MTIITEPPSIKEAATAPPDQWHSIMTPNSTHHLQLLLLALLLVGLAMTSCVAEQMGADNMAEGLMF